MGALAISIVMPCLNECETLAWSIRSAKALLQSMQINGEVIVADNGSTDGSQSIALLEGARLIHVPHRGYGAALAASFAAAQGQYIVMGDCDASYDFLDASAMIEQLGKGYDLCMGSRMRGAIEPGAMPALHRYLGNPVLTTLLNFMIGSSYSDAFCGLRAFRAAALPASLFTSKGMEFAIEMLVHAHVLGLRTTEVPICLHVDGRDRPPHLHTWSDGWRTLSYMVTSILRSHYIHHSDAKRAKVIAPPE